MWKVYNKLFGWQYVLLVWCDGRSELRRAYEMGGCIYASPHLPETRSRLLPQGEIDGRSYIEGWRPLTSKTFDLFNQHEPCQDNVVEFKK